MVSLGRTTSGITVIYADKLDEAISYFDRVLEMDPAHSDALFNKARALIQQNKTNEGLSYIDRVLEIEPNHVDVLTFKGDKLIGLNKTSEGLEYIDRVLEIDPKHPDALFNKGSGLFQSKNILEAFDYFDKLLKINPDHALAQKNLEIAGKTLGYSPLDGFMEVTVHDSEGRLASHLFIPELSILNHQISKNLIDEWEVTKTVNRNGTDYDVLQYQRESAVNMYHMRGGAKHFGISYEYAPEVWYIYANYYQYLVQKGDTITFVYTVYRPIA